MTRDKQKRDIYHVLSERASWLKKPIYYELCTKLINMAMNKTFKRLLWAALIIAAGLVIFTILKPGWFMDLGMALTSGAKHRNAATEQPAFTLSAQQLSADVKADTANITKYLDKAVLVNGPVSAVDGLHVSLGNVVCTMDSTQAAKAASTASGTEVKIQGRITSYNDMLEEINLDQCVFK